MRQIVKKNSYSNNQSFVFWTSLAFYFLLWFLNPENKIIVLAFFGLIAIFYLRLRDIRLALLLTYLSSVIIFTGKTYLIQLIPPGIFPPDLFPLGYVKNFIISSKQIIILLMLFVLVRNIIKIKNKNKLIKFKIADLFITLFFLWLILSDLLVSRKPTISLLFSLSALEGLVLYFYLRVYLSRWRNFFNLLLVLFAAIIIFESFISFQQFIASSPVFKNIELQVNLEYFGNAADELLFRFRPVGTFDHANALASFLLIPLMLFFVMLYDRAKSFNLFVFTLGVITLVITLSRSAWIALFLSIMLTLFILEKIKHIKLHHYLQKYKLILVVFGFIVFIFFIFPRVEKSFYSFGEDEGGGYLRKQQIETTLNLIIQNPIFGVGTLMSVERSLEIDPEGIFTIFPEVVHNWYLLVVVEHGIPALCFFILFVIFSISKTVSKFQKDKDFVSRQVYSLGFVSGIFALFIVGLFQPVIWEILIILSSALINTTKS